MTLKLSSCKSCPNKILSTQVQRFMSYHGHKEKKQYCRRYDRAGIQQYCTMYTAL